MLHFPSKQLSKKQQYKFLSGSIIPRPIAWVTTLNNQTNVINAAPFSFFNAASSDLPLMTLAILRKEGAMKDTARNILQNEEMVIHLIDQQIVEQMNLTAASLPPDQSELAMNQIKTTPSRSVSVPAIKAARLRMEARLYQHIPLKNREGKPITDLIVAEVTDFYFDETLFDSEKEYVLPENFHPIARLAGSSYAELGEIFDIERPK
ncbi:flavin reductase family protein [Enterococcus sp. BWB1-3]|uniref:flavin reductase family protein n=1 Tax=unclassified Enterococcus TaxID=2608891 RepID=UPI0019218946|nr:MULTISPECIES: flavin reductase family protein [unclassified Enterococcus]MBL1228889.1 flavin reductase family protein [Enterococcus sp. BWB1-3]MCB5951568.1 flavin reductase family protein [Enterococcus sp. BWT-B8]